MKRITIYQENIDPIVLEDEVEDLPSLKAKLGDIFKSTNIMELETNNKSISLRPSKVNSILIEDLETNNNNNEFINNEEENILTDGE